VLFVAARWQQWTLESLNLKSFNRRIAKNGRRGRKEKMPYSRFSAVAVFVSIILVHLAHVIRGISADHKDRCFFLSLYALRIGLREQLRLLGFDQLEGIHHGRCNENKKGVPPRVEYVLEAQALKKERDDPRWRRSRDFVT